MPFCPSCRYEFTEGTNDCNTCGVKLVDSLKEEGKNEIPVEMKFADLSELQENQIFQIESFTFDEARLFAHLLTANGISAQIQTEEEELSVDMCTTGGCGKKRTPDHVFSVVVEKTNAEKAVEFIKRMMLGDDTLALLESKDSGPASSAECPSCGTEISLESKECPECGLFLGEDINEMEDIAHPFFKFAANVKY